MQTYVRTPIDIFSPPQRLVVPVYQRRYVWSAETQWEPLWNDIVRIAEKHLAGQPAQHFLGAVVTQTATPGGMGLIASHALVDGQQRLTTLQLVVDATAAELESAGLSQHAQQLATLTHNPQAYELTGSEALKLVHQNDDRLDFVAVMSAEPPVDYDILPKSRLVEAHRYFAEQVRGWLGDPVDSARAQALVSTLNRGLQVVVIALEHDEPSQEIFETLNARGTPLTAADLVKNFVFQKIVSEGGSAERAFRSQWHDLEKPFWTADVGAGVNASDRLSLFINHWLVAKTGQEVSPRSTFTRFKTWFDDSPSSMESVLDSLHRQAVLFEAWVRQSRHKDGDLDQVPLFLYRTESLDLEAVKPLLLRLFDVDHPLPSQVSAAALRDVESWVMRRGLLRCPASDYRHSVAGLIADLRDTTSDQVATVLRASLQRFNRPGNYWPGNIELERELVTAPIYTQPKARLRAYLEAVEDAMRGYASGRPSSDSRVRRAVLTIEHLLPQKWQAHWPVASLSDELERSAHVHRLGNLTLLTQWLNSSISNSGWNDVGGKRAALAESDTLLMTRAPRSEDEWTEPLIDARTAAMARALVATWPAPEGHDPRPSTSQDTPSTSRVGIRELVAAGALAVGTVLAGRHGDGTQRTVTVLADGRLECEGKSYDTPSGVGRSIAGHAVNGWTFLRLPDGRKLMDVWRSYTAALEAESHS